MKNITVGNNTISISNVVVDDCNNFEVIGHGYLHYNVITHEILLNLEKVVYSPLIARLYTVMDNIIHDRITDFKASATFEEPGEWNDCPIGKYNDMPGEEERLLIYNSIDPELWKMLVDSADAELKEEFEAFLERIK